MNKKEIYSELNKLIKKAKPAFSAFKVAAILKTDKGYFSGINVEPNILNLGICAERNACFNALTNGMKKIFEIHILTSNPKGDVNMCGACREVLSQFSDDKTEVFVFDHKGNSKQYLLFDLIPQNITRKSIK